MITSHTASPVTDHSSPTERARFEAAVESLTLQSVEQFEAVKIPELDRLLPTLRLVP